MEAKVCQINNSVYLSLGTRGYKIPKHLGKFLKEKMELPNSIQYHDKEVPNSYKVITTKTPDDYRITIHKGPDVIGEFSVCPHMVDDFNLGSYYITIKQ